MEIRITNATPPMIIPMKTIIGNPSIESVEVSVEESECEVEGEAVRSTVITGEETSNACTATTPFNTVDVAAFKSVSNFPLF